MKEIINQKQCCGCHACFNICPQKAIIMLEDEKGFKYPEINQMKCINCGMCQKVCPILKQKKIENEPKAYACYNKNEEERKNSSSGGIFILIAKEILNRNGVVFGAALDKNFKVKHIEVEKEEELKMLMGSKYVQSDINDTYKKVKDFLVKDRYVLFTGTPCQIEGLRAYLIDEYDKLYTQDIICHGVPSALTWEKYKEYRLKKDKQEAQEIYFRNKDNGWKLFNMKFKYKDKEYKKNLKEDMFMRAFLNNLILRDSCYDCHFKKKNRISDITLADYWGIQNVHPELNDNKGISLAIINSNKGNELFERIKEKIVYKTTDYDKAISYNTAMVKSVEKHKNREYFFENINNIDFEKLIKKCIGHKNKYLNKLIKIKNFLRGK